MSAMMTFNAADGFLEGIVRGYRSGILSSSDYANLCQCDNLEDVRLHLSGTDYGNFLQNEPSPLATTVINDKAVLKLVSEFEYMRNNASEPLATFLDYVTYSYMIDNVVLLITGTLHERDTNELLEKCHPLGYFDTLPTLTTSTSPAELYRLVLVDTPLANYFSNCLKVEDLDEMNIEIIRNTLYKEYLEDFYRYCQTLPGSTGKIMGEILRFEADRRCINMTLNSFGTELSKPDLERLFPKIGTLYPEGLSKLARAEDFDGVKAACEHYELFRDAINDAADNPEKSLEDAFFAHEVALNKESFMEQFHYAFFYSYVKLREQEVRNIVWISECLAQEQKHRINQYIPIF